MARILLIDDDLQAAGMLGQWLGCYGFEVETVSQPAEALRRLQREEYQLALCSLTIEDPLYPTGLELALAIAASKPASSGMPVVLTAPEDLGASEWRRLRRHGVDFISKYHSLEGWAKKIQSLLATGNEKRGAAE